MHRVTAFFILGARPQFIKSAPLIREILSTESSISLTIVHSGQHYDPEMSEVFFSQLKLPHPKLNLRIGSGSHASQIAALLLPLEQLMIRMRPDVVIVPGDTNTTLGAALAAAKCSGVRVAHLEAGLRSGDISMPEEVNRILTDHCSSLLFAPTRTSVSNLAAEGLAKYTRLTGDTMVDALRLTLPAVARKEKTVLRSLDLDDRSYLMVTLHRPSNVDDPVKLFRIMRNLEKIGKKITVLFPVHPRTQLRLKSLHFGKSSKQVRLINPQGYVEALALLKHARCLLTDSGGMQKEAFQLSVPCVTLRNTTEWPETLVGNSNRLANIKTMLPLIAQAASSDIRTKHHSNVFGDGRAARKIRIILENELQATLR